MAREFTPYSTADPLMGQAPGWITDPIEQSRVGSYELYEQIYWCVPESFELVQRGEDDSPIYIPAGRTIVETLHRYMANDMQILPDPAFGSDTEKANALIFWTDMVRRERFYSVFNTNKRMGIIRGDWIFHMRGDPERPEGTRISIETIHPGQLFAIYETDELGNENKDTVIGWHVIERVTIGSDERVKRTTYRKTTETGGPSPITMEQAIFEVDAWGGAGQEEKLVEDIQAPVLFPAPIDQLPIYHIKNSDNGEFLWGSSEMRGLERVLAAVDQSISDEELELVLNGLGAYATNADEPDDGWDLGPGRVVRIPGLGQQNGGVFERITGTTTVAPHQDHLKYLHDRLDESTGISAVAKGRVDVQTAESGISLMMQLAPLLSRATEKEQIVTDVISNYMFDLAKWVIAYEGTSYNFLLEKVRFVPVYGDKIPVNRKERFAEIMSMATAQPMPLIPLNVAWDELRKIGYELPENDQLLQALLEQREAAATAEADAMANRLDREAAGDEEEAPGDEEEESGTEQEGEG